MNVWIAFLNFETMYGTKESIKEIYERALLNNDSFTIQQQLVNIYVRVDKIEVSYTYISMVELIKLN